MRSSRRLIVAASLLLRPCFFSPFRPLSATVMPTRTRRNQQASSNGTTPTLRANGNGNVAAVAAAAGGSNGTAAAAAAPTTAATTTTTQPPSSGPNSAASPPRAPLSAVVTDAVKRWYEDAEKEAERGDVKQQALLAQMLTEGYGCAADPEAARTWADKAKRRGYRMRGVYCTI